jgi:hypothetical protein
MSASQRRRRIERKPTLGQRIKLMIEMPRLPRSQRNQRLAIFFIVVVFALYFLAQPVINSLMGEISVPKAENVVRTR